MKCPNVSDAGLEHLAGLTRLFMLNLAGTQVTDAGLDIRVTSCLWAETFRAAGAGDLGYAVTCYQDVGMAEALGDLLTMERPSTLMEGGEACVFHFLRR